MIHDEILHKWINKTISAEELEKFKQRPEYEELVQLYGRTDDLQAPTFDANEMLADILATEKKEVVSEKPQAKVVAFPNWAKLAIAAALIGLVTLFFFPFDNDVEITTAKDKTQEIILPDGSEITLFGNSHITYYEKKWQEKREVVLAGEAIFEVEKGVPFTVFTHWGTIEVLGTVFKVGSRSQNFAVLCKEGEVAISLTDKDIYEKISGGESVNLTPTETLINKKNLTKFKNVNLNSILREIETQFEVKIEKENVNLEQRLTGSFQHQDLEKALKTTIGTMSDVNYKIQGKKVIIK